MHREHLQQLRRLAMTPTSNSRELLARVRAMDELARGDGRIPVEQFTEVLIEAMENRSGTWEGSRAASKAARLLTFIEECQAGDGMEWPSDTPDAFAGPDYWPGPDDEFAALDTQDLQGERDAWRVAVQGPPPWKPDEVLAE
jgi:hypothetical protein